jgi:hypothetical protein
MQGRTYQKCEIAYRQRPVHHLASSPVHGNTVMPSALSALRAQIAIIDITGVPAVDKWTRW